MPENWSLFWSFCLWSSFFSFFMFLDFAAESFCFVVAQGAESAALLSLVTAKADIEVASMATARARMIVVFMISPYDCFY